MRLCSLNGRKNSNACRQNIGKNHKRQYSKRDKLRTKVNYPKSIVERGMYYNFYFI